MKRLSALPEEKRALLRSRLRQQRHAPASRQPIPARADPGNATLSFAQEHFWLLEQLAPGSLAYNRPTNARIHGPLDPAILERSLNEIARRHEVLRTHYRQTEDLPIPVVSDAAGLRLDVVDLRSLPEPDRRSECLRLAIGEARRPFDLAAIAPVRARLFRVADEEHLLSFTVHHIAFDGWSQGIFFRELGALYHALRRDEAPSLPAPPIRYSDYAHWQRQWAEGPEGERRLQYWRDHLRGATPILELPADHDRPATQRDHGARHAFLLPRDLMAELEALGRRESATVFMTLLAAFKVLLFRYTGQGDIIVGSPFSGRTRPETESLVGLLANTLPLRTDLSGNPPFAGLLHRVRDVSLAAQAHQDTPLQRIIQNIPLLRDFSRNALFQHLFVLQNTPGPSPGPGETRFLPEDLDIGTSKLDLSVELRRTEHGLGGFIEYDADLFEAETIARMAGHWRRLLEAIAANPSQRIAELPMLTDGERHRLLVEWNDTRRDHPPRNCVHELFEAQVRKSPDAIAAIFEGSHLTYAELNARANQLAHFLRASSVGPEVLVGVCLERSPDMAVALLAILKAGGAYVPLDPDYPRERLAFIMEDSRPAIVLTVTSLIDRFADPGIPVVCLDAERGRIARHDRSDPPSLARPENAIYVIYTSGSTGKPKGAINTHRGIANMLLWEREALGLDGADRALLKTTLNFDISVVEFFLPLICGGGVVFARPGGQREPAYLARLIQTHGITTAEFVPSHLRALVDEEAFAQCLALKRVTSAGEALPLDLAQRFFQRSGARLYNSYGPTETSGAVTRWECPRDPRKITIGRPGHNILLYILDTRQSPVPVGVPGELYIGGIAVGRGYLNRPELTAERFIPDPFSDSAGARMYRTGDRCRYLPDGSIEFLGRLDNQVKIRGHRIELGEVEAPLRGHPAIAEAAAAVQPSRSGEPILAAFVVPKNGPPEDDEARARLTDDLRQSLCASLPEPMVPKVFHFLPDLPRLPNGKLDRRALSAIEPASPLATGDQGPRSPTEIRLASIWSQILGIGSIGPRDNFFEIGGHSLRAAQIISRIQRDMGVTLPLRAIFEFPTIADLARRIVPVDTPDTKPDAPRAPHADHGEEWPLSFAQQRLWFIQQLEPHSALYNVTHAMRLRGALDAAVLGRCLREIVLRHAALRTTFPVTAAGPVQRINPRYAIDLPITDLSHLPPADRDTEFRRLAEAMAGQPFNLADDAMLRTALFRLGTDEHVLTLVLHHIATDGWSQAIIWRELAALYGAFLAGRPSPLPAPHTRYVDHAVLQRRHLDQRHLEHERLYWRQRLAGAPAILEFPFDHPCPRSPTYRAASFGLTLDPDLTSALRRLSNTENVTLFTTLLAAFKVLLARHAGQEDIVVGSPVAGRMRPESEPVVGLFLNTVALRTDLGGNPTFRDLLQRVRETALGALAHQEFPFERVVEELRPKRLHGRNPLFDVLFNFLQADPPQEGSCGLAMEPIALRPRQIQFAMTLYATPRAGQIGLDLVYREELFCAERMRHLIEQYHHLLRQVAEAPDARIRRFSLVTPSAKASLPDPAADLPAPRQGTVIDMFAGWAARAPEQTAICHPNGNWSYAELSQVARDIAARIIARGARPAEIVAITGEKCPALVAGLLAALAAGCVILPIDPSLSPRRKRLMFQTAGARHIIRVGADPPGERWLEEAQENAAICLDPATGHVIGHASRHAVTAPPSPHFSDRAPAYVFFTSGTTGTPKAVLGSHSGLAHFLNWQRAEFGIGPADRVAQLTSLSFDVVLRDIFLPLTSGATLCVPMPDQASDGQALIPWLESQRVSVLHAVPTIARHWLDTAPSLTMLPSLRRIFFAGEPLSDELVRRWRARSSPNCEIINLYGPTETTLVKSYHRVPAAPAPGIQPVGRPLPNTQALVLGDAHQPCGIGEIGEIVIRSPFRTLGYLNLPNQPGFVQNPFRTDPEDLLYHTGDLGRFRPDGVLEIFGRRDDQVKIRGVRIEPSEVAAAIGRHPAVRDCAVLPVIRQNHDPELAAFVVAADPRPDLARELRSFLSRELPAAMIPSQFIALDRLPRTPNGKVDRRALSIPESGHIRPARSPTPPQDPLQAQLVGLWTELLVAGDIGIDDDFFDLGGHSLMATRLISRLRDLLGIEIPLRDLFEHPTIADFAARIRDIRAERQIRSEDATGPVTHTADHPLSFSQQRLWFLDRLLPGSAAYNIPVALRFTGTLDTAALERALREIVRRHAILRTTYHEVSGEPIQRVAPDAALPIAAHDLRGIAESERESSALILMAQAAREPFDLSRDPPLRASLLRLSDTTQILALTIHHIAADGWSVDVLLRELTALYGAFVAGQPSPLPGLPIQYADHAIWQVRQTQTDAPAYWTRQLGDIPPSLALPTDHPRPPSPSLRGDIRSITLGADLKASLESIGRREGATLFMTLLAAFQTLLGRYSGQDIIAVGTPVAGRNRIETEPLIGFFVNTLVLRTDLSGDPTFRDVLRRVRETTLDALAHQDLPFEKLVENLRPGRDSGHTPLFQVMFVLQEHGPASVDLPGIAADRVPPVHTGTAKFDLSLSMRPVPSGLEAALEFSTDLFEAATAERMLAHLKALLRGISNAPETPIGLLPIIDDEERHRLLVGWNDTRRDLGPPRCVHQLFEARARETPEAIALVSQHGSLTFAELNARANRLAHHLISLSVGPETFVGVCLERSNELAVAMLAILKAGGAFIPMDPDLPRDRINFIAADGRPAAIVTTSSLAVRFAGPSPPIVRVDGDAPQIASHPDTDPPCRTDPGDAVYAIYTSGSTGEPKGAINLHRGICNKLLWQVQAFGLDASERVLFKATPGFDVSVNELFLGLVSGARTIIARPGGQREPDYLAELIIREGVTMAEFVPAMLRAFLDQPRAAECRSLRRILCGGDTMSRDLLDLLRQKLGARAYNCYGPTETSIGVTQWECERDYPRPRLPIGRPGFNIRIYILDRWGNPAPIGVPGELHIGGAAVGRGYLNRPRLTAECFIPDPFSKIGGDRLYRTGDRCRYLPDGNIEFLGRADSQVKIRGNRVEPGEIEAAILRHPAILHAAVVDQDIPPNDRFLAAYLVARPGLATDAPASDRLTEDLRRMLAATLPRYMIPAAFEFLPALPRLPSGKVNRSALPVPATTPAATSRHVPPETPTEMTLAQIWGELLKLEHVGIHDNFFDIGGHSLLAIRVVSRIRETTGANVPLRALFDAPTIHEFAAHVDRASALTSAKTAPAPTGRDVAGQPLSFAQSRLWFIWQLQPDSPLYNIPIVLRIRGALDRDALARALSEIVRRHAVLRTTFHPAGDEPVQRIADATQLPLPLTPLGGDGQHRDPERLQEAIRREVSQPFDLARDRTIRARLIQIDDDDHVLCLTLHHIAADGWSIDVLHKELSALYGAFAADRPTPLPEPTLQYADYARWQRAHLRGERLEIPLDYWRARITGAPVALELPTDRPRPPVSSHRGGRRHLTFDLPRHLSIATLARAEGCTPFMVLLAAFKTLLFRCSGQEDIVVGSPFAGRDRTETDPLIGFFVNTLPLRTDLSGNPTFRELIGRVRETTLGALAHQALPFERLVEEMHPERHLGRTPVFQVVFVYQNEPGVIPDLPGLDVSRESVHTATAKFDLVLSIAPAGDGLRASLEFSTDLFDAATIDRMLGHFRTLLEAATNHPDTPIGNLPLLGEAERHQILVAWNATQTDYPRERCIHELFEERARLSPRAIAVTCGRSRLTYAELDDRANRLARYLLRSGIAPGTPVGVALARSTDLAVALLAILKAGAAYVPLDTDYPAQRLAFMIEDTRIPVVLTQASLSASLPPSIIRKIPLDIEWPSVAREDPGSPQVPASPENLAYIIYTSGSTGQPKGVCITHRGVVRLVRGTGYARLDSSEVFLQFAPLSFDAATFEIWGALLNGARLVFFPPHPPSLRELGRVIRDSGITTLWLTAGLFHKMIDQQPQDLRGVRQLLAGGDILSPHHVRRALKALPDCTLINGYGPTENTTFSCCHTLRAHDPVPDSIPIGRPISNSEAYVLDRRLQPAPIGVPGELYLGGDGLARGYLNRPDLDAGHFVAHPFRDDPAARLYRSGDLARWRPDGALEFLGRIDGQVKIRGFRIELAEVEAGLGRHPAVRDCAAVARQEGDGERFLTAAIVPADPQAPPDADALREFLRQALPAHMIPSAFLYLRGLPLTENGKIDRAALQSIPLARSDPRNRYAPPETPSQLVLTHLWEELLNARPIGIRDDFFALGGHSLLAASMLGHVEQLCGKKIPLTTFFAEPTIACLSRALLDAQRDEADSPVVTIQTGDGRNPFFFLHGDFSGGGFYCRKFARQLGEDQAFHAIHPHGLMGRRLPASIQAMAADHLRHIRAVQPEGPYRIGGHCNGALEAYEIACRLRAQGEQVELLAMIAPPQRPRLSHRSIGFFALRQIMRPLLPLIASDAFGSRFPKARQNLLLAAYAAISWSYFPPAYPGRVMLFQPKDRARPSDDPSRGWRDRAPNIEIVPLPRGHATAITSHVDDLARCIRPLLRPPQPP